MKKLIFRIIGLIIVLVIISHSSVALAASTIDSLNNEKNKNNQQAKDIKDEKDKVTAEKNKTVQEVEELNTKISEYESQISELEGKLRNLNNQIGEKENQINQAQEDYTKQEELLEKRLVAMQESGDTSFLDVLLNSKGLVDFISNYYLISEMANSDTKLLKEIQDKKTEIENAKAELEKNKNEVTTTKASVQGVETQLKSAKAEKDKKVANLTEDEKALQAQIDELAQANKAIDSKMKQIQEQIRKEAEEEAKKHGNSNNGASNNGGVSISAPSAAGFILPVPTGYKTITTGLYYSSGQYHGAVDFGSGGINGQPIYAVADGKVVISERLQGSYGNYIVIYHNNGLFTLYAHGQDGSRAVQVGQTVKQGQQIMRVGTTGNSSGPHLHFEVRKYPGNYSNRVDPRPYLPK